MAEVETEVLEAGEGDNGLDTAKPKFFSIEFKYTEPVEGQVVIYANDVDHAKELALAAVPAAITDFVITAAEAIDENDPEYAEFKAVLLEREGTRDGQAVN